MAKGRDQSRPGGPLYRTDTWTAPSDKKAKGKKPVGVRTVKKARQEVEVTPQIPAVEMTNGRTLLEQSIETEHDINELRYIGDVGEEQEGHPRSGSDDMMDIDDKEQATL
ncbi:hypothetical protein PI124_g9035 [Phytophthora idaei]|nr:hypothetical protein PI124_g9035 [Phytophthora idaei]